MSGGLVGLSKMLKRMVKSFIISSLILISLLVLFMLGIAFLNWQPIDTSILTWATLRYIIFVSVLFSVIDEVLK